MTAAVTTCGPTGRITLTPRMQAMILASEPSDLDHREGAGVEIRTPADYAVAKALKHRALGTYSHGSPYGDLYFNNSDGLAVRRELRGEPDPDDMDQNDD
jgi:hypothetical protein